MEDAEGLVFSLQWQFLCLPTDQEYHHNLKKAYEAAKADPAFHSELAYYLKHYVGRPSPLWYAQHLSEQLKDAKIYFKCEELNHTGSHKLNNVMGQILLARRMGRKRIIAETEAGQHGIGQTQA
ncbi:Tryptophan synthase beta chain [Entomobacter blattae]|uniref:tryptophan synthase n=1 Tax=Entomobacter blattae TaxID=2762277 RepID=A0A7H1NS04_9PROT|nr:Tryptophan synthase beta chain [Entomobacter blattae]